MISSTTHHICLERPTITLDQIQGAEDVFTVQEASALRKRHAACDSKMTRQTFSRAGPHVHNCFIS